VGAASVAAEQAQRVVARALNGGYRPDDLYPWQKCLLDRFLAFPDQPLPACIDIPTGLGKTAVMAIWLAARAYNPQLPRRLVYVVDRRAVVDQATTVAERLREIVDRDPELSELRQHLRLDGSSLPISTLRGRHVDNAEWRFDPSLPAIIVGTVDMVGSRLLFSGYGVSRKLRPYQAGILGVDTLYVVDEAHLVPPFQRLLEEIAHNWETTYGPSGGRSLPVPRLHVLPLSATGLEVAGEAFRLGPEDLEDEAVQLKLKARKPLKLSNCDTSKKDGLVAGVVESCWKLLDEDASKGTPARYLVYLDKREDAQKVHDALAKRAKRERREIRLELLTGARRIRERELVAKTLNELGFLVDDENRERVLDQNGRYAGSPAVLVATAAGEVGVDLDADRLVCDLVSWERMVQRFGRVNRRGCCPDARIVVCVDADLPSTKGSSAATNTAADSKSTKKRNKSPWLPPVEALSQREDGASLHNLMRLGEESERDLALRKEIDEATSPEPCRPPLTLPVVEAWALTTLEDHPARPLPGPWLRGWRDDGDAQTTLIWRTLLPLRQDVASGEASNAEVPEAEIKEFFEQAMPLSAEQLDCESQLAASLLKERANAILKQEEKDNSQVRHRAAALVLDRSLKLEPNGLLRIAYLAKLNRQELKELESRISRRLVVIDAALGGLSTAGVLAPDADGPVATMDTGWVRPTAEQQQGESTNGPPADAPFLVRVADREASPFVDERYREAFRMPYRVSSDGEPEAWLCVGVALDRRLDEEQRSLSRTAVLLDDHHRDVAEHVRAIARRLQLDDSFEEMLTRAAELHDLGKDSRRWQRAFHAPIDGVFAKTRGPCDWRSLDGYRHELGSLWRVLQSGALARHLSEELSDLAMHLIAAHHGFARSKLRVRGCDLAPPSVLEELEPQVALRYGRLQAAWGPWGLAWWEALLRAADQQASAETWRIGD